MTTISSCLQPKDHIFGEDIMEVGRGTHFIRVEEWIMNTNWSPADGYTGVESQLELAEI